MAGNARVLIFKTLGFVLETLPERVDVWLATRVARTIGGRNRSTRAAIGDNLRHVLTTNTANPDEKLVSRFVDRAFASYGHYWAESAKLPAISPTTIVRRFRICEGLEYLYESRERGRGTVLALPHVGSWEWGGAFLAQLDMPMTAVAEVLEPAALFEWFRAKREALGIRVEPLDEHAGGRLLAHLRGGGLVGLLCDRDIQNNGIEVEFFGERVTVPAGPATLALRTGATLMAAACYSGPGRDHFAVVTPPIPAQRLGRLREDVTRVTQAVTYELEDLIRRAPEQWHVLQPRFGEP